MCQLVKEELVRKKLKVILKTTKGMLSKFLNIFYRKDRVFNLKTNIPKSHNTQKIWDGVMILALQNTINL